MWEMFDRAFWRSDRSFSLAARAAGEEKVPEEQAAWFGQPAQAEDFPAEEEVGPTQPSLALGGGASAMIYNEKGGDVMCTERDKRWWVGMRRGERGGEKTGGLAALS